MVRNIDKEPPQREQERRTSNPPADSLAGLRPRLLDPVFQFPDRHSGLPTKANTDTKKPSGVARSYRFRAGLNRR